MIVIEPVYPNHQGQMLKYMLKEIRPVIERYARIRARSSPLTEKIETFLLINAMPVDTRHNVKINREALAVWAKEQLKR